MSLNTTPSSERIHIGIFGRRNAGKSSLINALTGQDTAIVSDRAGTTTDPVTKAMELLPLGPVVIIDTPGIDDEGDLGVLRIKRAYEALNRCHIALLVVDASVGMNAEDEELLSHVKAKELPYLLVYNKADLFSADKENAFPDGSFAVSAKSGAGIQKLKEAIASLPLSKESHRRLTADLVRPLDLVVLVVPIDSAAPKGRLILPQQQVIRDILEAGAVSIVVRESELADTLEKLGSDPNLVITDSQVFEMVAKIVPDRVPLTSFSILFSRYKGNLEEQVLGAYMIDRLKDGDTVLISEGCTHHRQCDDIGTVKLPRWLTGYTGKNLNFTWTSGGTFPEDLSPYRLIIHCGGCMLNEKEMKSRIRMAKEQDIPITNYGTAIAHMKGILSRSIKVFNRTF